MPGIRFHVDASAVEMAMFFHLQKFRQKSYGMMLSAKGSHYTGRKQPFSITIIIGTTGFDGRDNKTSSAEIFADACMV